MQRETTQVEYSVQDHVAWVAMKRPSVMNALSQKLFRGLTSAVKTAVGDKQVRFIAITGRGKAFSAGLDIKEVAGFESISAAKAFVYGLIKPFWTILFDCPKPIVSVVNGPAYGAGAEIVLASDIVIASTKSTFAFSGGRVGALCCISAIIGPLILNGRKVVEMNLTGETLDASEAKDVGLVNYVVSPRMLVSATERILRQISHVSPISNASFKKALWNTVPRSSFDEAYRQLLNTITSPDFQKGSRAFARKQLPDFG